MPRFAPEPAFAHDTPERTAVLLINLGTPEAPTKTAVTAYLRQFLWDPRVVEIPRPLWWLILNGFILPSRPAKSAAKYAKVWTSEGSPLKVHTARQMKRLEDSLRAAGHGQLMIEYAMRYGEPAIARVLESLRAANCRRILAVPLYPQYAASTCASALDEIARAMLRWRNVPELRFVRSFHGHPGYIAALAASVRDYWSRSGQPDRLLMSFHGVPRYTLTMGDPYHCECQVTARLLGEALGLSPDRYMVSFQSRFGRAEWLKPYTQSTLETLAKGGAQRVDVICPGFVSDCLETLEEIALECKAAFLASGGREFHFVPCLNERPEWIKALMDIVLDHLGNWLRIPVPDEAALALRASRARALGAPS